MSVALLQERPPYIRFDVGTMEARDEHGMPIVKDVAMIFVTPAGSKDVHEAIAEEWISKKEELARRNPPEYHPEWANRFRASFKLWSDGQTVPEFGTPVRTWPALSPSEVRRCIEANVLTVEDLAQANEGSLMRLGMGGRSLKDKAVAWLSDSDRAKSASETAALKAHNEDLQRQIDAQSQAIQRLTERIAEGDPKPRRGRPPNSGAQVAPDLDDRMDAIR